MIFEGTLSALPAQVRGYNVGDILLLKRNLTGNGDCDKSWFRISNSNWVDFFPGFIFEDGTTIEGSCKICSMDKVTMNSLFKLALPSVATMEGKIDKTDRENYVMSVENPKITSAWKKIKGTMLDDEKMAPLLQSVDCAKEWLIKNTAVVCVVHESFSGPVFYEDENGTRKILSASASVTVATAPPVEVGAEGGVTDSHNTSTTANFDSSVFAFALRIYKVARVGGNFYSQGPSVVDGPSCPEIKKAPSFLKLGDIAKKDFFGKNHTQLKKMVRVGHYVANTDPDVRSWSQAVSSAMEGGLNSSLGLPTSHVHSTQGVFRVGNTANVAVTQSSAGRALQRYAEAGCQPPNGGTIPMDTKNGIIGSVNVIVNSTQEVFTHIFDAFKRSDGKLDLGDGWFLQGIRVALEFDCDDVGLVPVSLPEGLVNPKDAPVTVFRWLESAACLLTPVDHAPPGDDALGRIFGNGGFDDWDMNISTEFVDPKDLSRMEPELIGKGYTQVKRSCDDIDGGHMVEHMKFVRYTLEPESSLASKGPEEIPDDSPDQKPAAKVVSPIRKKRKSSH